MEFCSVPTSRMRRARRSLEGVGVSGAAGLPARPVDFGKGGFDMWMKDSKGNWYMAGQEPIQGISEIAGGWEKDASGGWVFLATTVGSLTGVKGQASIPVHSPMAL